MRILVTGGAGFIGSHVAERFVAEGHEVAVVDDLSTGFRRNLPPGASFERVDLCDGPALERVLAAFRPEVVDHHAAQIDVRQSVRDPLRDATINILGGLNLLGACVRHGVRKLIYASTGGALYGEGRRLPAAEDHPVNPESPYGVSKHAFESYLALWRRQYGLDSTVLRYPNVYGPRQNPHGEAGVNAIFIGQLLAGSQPRVFGDGQQVRDYLYVDDVAQANVLALTAGSGETLNLGTGTGTSVLDILDALGSILGVPSGPIHEPARAGEVQRIYLDASRARRVLGWAPTVSFADGLTRTVEWFRSASHSPHGAPARAARRVDA